MNVPRRCFHCNIDSISSCDSVSSVAQLSTVYALTYALLHLGGRVARPRMHTRHVRQGGQRVRQGVARKNRAVSSKVLRVDCFICVPPGAAGELRMNLVVICGYFLLLNRSENRVCVLNYCYSWNFMVFTLFTEVGGGLGTNIHTPSVNVFE